MKRIATYFFVLCAFCWVSSAINPKTSILSSDFQNWLDSNGYKSDDFDRGGGYSYGGRSYSSESVSKTPVIFIHGNSDKAVGSTVGQTGWTDSIEYFLSRGYRQCELYAITWGPASALQSPQQYHSKPYLTRVRRFIEAVKSYTGKSKVNVIGHSMGVTLARKAIKGGSGHDSLNGGYYNLGSRLNFVDTFIGIAGANLGLSSCYFSGPTTPTCGNTNGFYPGYLYLGTGPYGVSDFLEELNADSSREASYIFSIWSSVDEVIGGGSLVYGKVTCRINGQSNEKVYSTVPYGHFGVKDKTASVQYNMVTYHRP
ncbi:hypothetical protein TrispH2_003162 [Trichoplax sp. H2]|nr:hypothetical protein TrispH2_003162 [Trichoplax sp. H2]|eukprot:RDD45022.1 hypothetical protein TrispH2_003162 [Trichoplax sp. H2]